MSQIQINQVHPYSLRQARIAAYRLSQKIDKIVWGGDWLIPSELSVKQSSSWEGDGKAKTAYTFRFEGGKVIRVNMNGWHTDSFGFQWEPESALVRYQKDDSWDAPKLTLIVENLREELPETEEAKIAKVATESATAAETLEAFEALLQEATDVQIRKIRYAADYFSHVEPVWFEEYGLDHGSPWGELVVEVGNEFFGKFAEEIAKRDEKIVTFYLRSKAFSQQAKDGIVFEYGLRRELQKITSFHLAADPIFVPAHIYEQAVTLGDEDGSQEIGSAKVIELEPEEGYIRKMQVVLPEGYSIR